MAKTIGILLCDETYGEDSVGKFYIDLFKKNEVENWEYFKVVSGCIPDLNSLHNYIGFILTGSCWSANDQAKWILDLVEFINHVIQSQLKSNDAPKLFGFCFGHQLICKTLGARVTKNEVGRFIISETDIKVFNCLQNKEFYKRVFHDKKYIRVVKLHEEEVTDLPPNAILLGSSEYCKNEIVSFGDKILSMQGHMDISEEDLLGTYLTTLKDLGKINEADEIILINSIKEKQNDCSNVIEMVRQFFYL
ncbi:uncharacterized protein LOC101240492 isoform X1 [Hydra vulgaris]|uniref:uncharacterized protein LOC101240492 isoform X1 n=1 Tax=Hydra vulgaris TaxID=6087 RepID=UPI001F5F7277|nr:gamma-glutamyl peptidase 3-like [Hydra vulgaris]